MPLDPVDLNIVQHLARDGRMSYAALGRLVNLSTAAVHYRVKALERRGVIRGYAARIDPVAVGLGLSGLVAVETWERAIDDAVPFAGLRASGGALTLWAVGYPGGLDPFAGVSPKLPEVPPFVPVDQA